MLVLESASGEPQTKTGPGHIETIKAASTFKMFPVQTLRKTKQPSDYKSVENAIVQACTGGYGIQGRITEDLWECVGGWSGAVRVSLQEEASCVNCLLQ